MIYGSEPFDSPSEVYAFTNTLILKLQNLNLDASPLERVQSTAYTTSSEWLGELGSAVREVQHQRIIDSEINFGLHRIMRLVHSVWPLL